MASTDLERCGVCGARLPVGTPGFCCPLCLEDDDDYGSDAEIGRLLGDCELFEELGRGGMGVVWRGRQRALQREVAVKTLPGGEFAGPDARARFRTEALAAARLKHPNIVSVHEVGEDDGMPYLVMELVQGRALGAVVAEGQVTVKLAARWVRDAALAVAHAHAQGVLHRDIKPANILIEPDEHGGRPRLTDFGLAKLVDADHALTLSGTAMGSPAFISPEQLNFGESSERSDVYGLGGVLYHAVTGRPPFQGESLATVLTQAQTGEIVPPRRLNPSVPADLETICLKCLERSPARRYASAHELAEDLTRFLEDRPVLARPLGWHVKLVRLARRHPSRAAVVFLGTAVMSGVVLFLIWRAQIESSHARALLQEKTATQLALARSRIDGARSAIRLPLPGSRSEVWEAMQEVLQTELPDDLRNDARDTALAAMTLPTVRTRSLTGEELETADWTLAAGDLARERWALGEYQGRVRMFSIAGGNAIAEFSTTPRKVTALIRFSPGGRWLAIRHRDELGIWDTTPGADQPMVFVAKPWGVARPFGFMHVDFAPDDGAVLWPDGDDVVATALPGGEEIGRWTARCEAIAFAPGNSVFALALDQGARVELRSWPSCEVKRIISAPASHSVEAIAVSPHAKWIALGDDTGRITVWSGNRENGRPLEFRGHTDAIRSLAFSPQGHLASSSEDGTVRLWDCSTESLILALPWEAGCLSFSSAANGLLGVGTVGQRMVCGEIGMPSILSRFRPEGALKWPQRVSVFPDGKSLVCLSDAGPVQCALPGGAVARSYAGPDVNSVLAAPEGDGTIYGGGVQGLRRWEPDGPEAGTECLPPVEGGWGGLTASANGELLGATTFNDRAFVWPASDRDASHRRELTLSDGGYFGFTISPDGAHAVATHRYEPGIVHFDTRSGEVTRKVDGFSPAHMPAWSPDGQWLVAVGTATVLWHTATWEQAPLPTLAPSLPPSVAAAFSHPAIDRDGKSRLLAVTNGGNRIAVIALPERRLIANLEAPGSQLIFDLEFSLDGHWLVAGSVRSEVQVWDLPALYALLDELGESQ